MSDYEKLVRVLKTRPKRWLVTGAAGFIGSHLVETLLELDQTVVGLDNFVTGRRQNLEEIRRNITSRQWRRFTFQKGDIRRASDCHRASKRIDYILHQAALGSVPRSMADPVSTHDANVDGFMNILMASRDSGVARIVFASSSSVYGDHPGLPKKEETLGAALSPYAVSKRVNELYAEVFNRCYGLETIGLRYFNVFGERQDPNGEYAAVIPRWISALLRNKPVYINGDGSTTRDFCYIANVVEANLLAATTRRPGAVGTSYNIALNASTSLSELFRLLRDRLAVRRPALKSVKPVYRPFRPGDVRHSQANITRAKKFLGYSPRYRIGDGLDHALSWYEENL